MTRSLGGWRWVGAGFVALLVLAAAIPGLIGATEVELGGSHRFSARAASYDHDVASQVVAASGSVRLVADTGADAPTTDRRYLYERADFEAWLEEVRAG